MLQLAQPPLTQEKLKHLLIYNPETGIFTGRIRFGRRGRGVKAGSVDGGGYISIRICGSQFKAHRLAFLYSYGYMPEYEIDHINGVKTDNRLKNLRHVTHKCNMQNMKIRNSNKSSFPGVHWNKKDKKWHANIQSGGIKNFLGLYKTALDAALARLTGEIWREDWTCNRRGELVKAIKQAWPAFNSKCLE